MFDMQFRTLCSFLVFFLCSNQTLGALFYPTNSAYGIFAAIAVPLDLPHRNVFISYNFEANYNLPYTWNIPPVAVGIEDEDLLPRHINNENCTNCTENLLNSQINGTENLRRRRSLFSRTHFYYILRDKFQRSGYSGKACLLRMICDINSSSLGDINGLLGNLIYIIFSPSTSMYENLPLSYYQAEYDGRHDRCKNYEDDCAESPVDLISKPIHDIIDSMMNKK